jgi:hypothetical protein
MLKPRHFLGFQLPKFERFIFLIARFLYIVQIGIQKYSQKLNYFIFKFQLQPNWLNLPMIDHHFNQITKFTKETLHKNCSSKFFNSSSCNLLDINLSWDSVFKSFVCKKFYVPTISMLLTQIVGFLFLKCF